MKLKDVTIPKFNNDNSIVFEDETWGGVFEEKKKPPTKGVVKQPATKQQSDMSLSKDNSSSKLDISTGKP